MPDPNDIIERPLSRFFDPLVRWLRLHQEKLWWLHSLYALILGIAFMWLGSRNFAYLRIAVFHISFIWLSSLLLPKLLNHPRLPARWTPGVRLLINYLNKNFYQQMLFFVLPIYYASATTSSRNVVFVLLVALSAVLSTLDIVYDRYLSVRRSWMAGFFAFNLFVLVNVMLPVLWSVSNTWTTRISAMAAAACFLTLYEPLARPGRRRMVSGILIAALLTVLVETARSFIPPAPLRLAGVDFGTDFQKESLQVEPTVTTLDPGGPLRLYGLTAIKAPLGLRENVRHHWYRNGKVICASPSHRMTGGREEGFRFWTACAFDSIPPGTELRLDLETEGGQLIGRARLKARRNGA